MPKVNHPNLGSVTNILFLEGTIIAVYNTDDTCDLTILGVGYTKIPIFYHCAKDSELRSNGAIYGGADAFNVGDKVILQAEDTKAGIVAKRIIGFKEGLKECSICKSELFWKTSVYEVTNLKSYSMTLPLPENVTSRWINNDSSTALWTKEKNTDGGLLLKAPSNNMAALTPSQPWPGIFVYDSGIELVFPYVSSLDVVVEVDLIVNFPLTSNTIPDAVIGQQGAFSCNIGTFNFSRAIYIFGAIDAWVGGILYHVPRIGKRVPDNKNVRLCDHKKNITEVILGINLYIWGTLGASVTFSTIPLVIIKTVKIYEVKGNITWNGSLGPYRWISSDAISI